MRRLLRQPLLHFVVLGCVLWCAQAVWLRLHPPQRPIVVDAAQVAQLCAAWQRQWGRAPDARELQGALRQWADDEILYREAIRLGDDRRDPVVRARLVQNLRFAGESGEAGGIFDRALALGMDRSDYVVRQRLIEGMRMRLESGVRLDEADVRAFVAAYPERYGRPPRYRVEQRYFAGDAHHPRGEAAAHAALARLREGRDVRGDAFLLGDTFSATPSELRERLGAAIAETVATAPIDTWTGPVRSAWGWHLLRVTQAVPAAAPDFARVRRQAYYALLDARQRAALQAALVALRARYPLQLEQDARTVAAR